MKAIVEQNFGKLRAMKRALCSILAAAGLMAGCTTSPTKQSTSTFPATTSPPSAAGAPVGNPLIAVSPSRLDFGMVVVGQTNCLTITVQNVGLGTLTGVASTSPPFSSGNATYALGSSQSQSLVVRYTPTATGTNLQSIALSGGGGATVAVIGRGVILPSAPKNFHIVANSH